MISLIRDFVGDFSRMESVPGSVHLLANEIYHHPSPVILLNGRNAYLRWLGLLYSTSVGIFVFSIEGNNVPPSSVTFLLQLWKLARRYRQTIAREVSLSLSVIPKRTRNVWMGREWRVLGFSIRRGADRVFRMACIAYSWPVRVRNAAAAWGIRGEDRGCTIR